MANTEAAQAGIDTRNRIVELVAENVDNGGDGMSRPELAAALGISRPTVHKHLTVLIADGRVEQIGRKVLPIKTGHIHVCRTCGKTMHIETAEISC
jgi:predicted ArsR family transcriptional regulator